MSFPQDPPNWNSGAPLSGWYVYQAETGDNIVWAMTGRELIRRIQAQLVSYFTSAPQSVRKAYRRGGPANAPDTDFVVAAIQRPGPGGAPVWGPVTNAALWRWAADHSMPQRWLDAIENVVRDRRVYNEALFAALWLINHYLLTFGDAERRIKLGTVDTIGGLVVPPYLAAAPADGLEAGQVYHWNANTENPPRPRSLGTAPPSRTPTTPTPRTTTPTPAPGPGAVTPPATTPSAPSGTFLGLTGLQWGVGVGALAAIGGVAYYLNVRDERPARHGVKFPQGYPRRLSAPRRM